MRTAPLEPTVVEQAALGLSEFLLATLSISFGAWSFALKGARADLKEMRDDFLKSMRELTGEIAHLRRDLNEIANRVTRAEADISHLQHTERHDHRS